MTRATLTALLTATLAIAQPAPEFEVASIRPANPQLGLIQNRSPSLNADPGGNINFANISLRDLMMLAYSVGARQITGPDSILDRYDIVARVAEDSKKEQVPQMLRTLLAQRFKLTIHRSEQSMQVYALEVAKSGPKLQEAASARADSGCSRSFAETPGATLAAVCKGVTSAEIAQQVQALAPGYFTDGPVIDATALKGVYDFKLEWITRAEANNGSDGPTMFQAVQRQLGLTLTSRKQPMETIIIDHIDKAPTEN